MSSENNTNEAMNRGSFNKETDAAAASGAQSEAAVDGEYHFSASDQSSPLYSDAQYRPQDEFTAPTRYYTPPEKKAQPKKTAQKPESSGHNAGWVRVLCLCLVCAILGGIGGGALSAQLIGKKLDAQTQAESGIPSDSDGVPNDLTSNNVATQPVTLGSFNSGDIYALACKQTVGIQTETKTNYFGMITTTPVVGSGFVISSDGYILTNYHVIKSDVTQGSSINVLFKDGTSYTASVVGSEEENDVAVLKIDADGLTPVTIGNSDTITVGEPVYAVGNPLGELEFTMTTGSVSALDRVIATESSSSAINMFQIDAAVNSGNSGGPVYNAQGQVIGIVTAKYASSGVEGLGFAIPINDAMDIAKELITNGYVSGKPAMGVQVLDVTSSMAAYYNMVVGAYVYSVTDGSAADKAGLQVSDIITQLGNEAITSTNDLKYAKKAYKAGDSAEITVYRAGSYQTLTIVFDEETAAASEESEQAQLQQAPDGFNAGGAYTNPFSGDRW